MIQIRHFIGMTLSVKIVPQDSFPFCEKLQDTQKLASLCFRAESRDLLQIPSLVYDSKHVLLALALARQVRFRCVPCFRYEECSCWEAEQLDLSLSVRCRREPARCHCMFWRCMVLLPCLLSPTDMATNDAPSLRLLYSSPDSCTRYEERSCREAERLGLSLSVRCRREPDLSHCTCWRCTLLPPRALCSTDMDRPRAMGLSHSSPESCTQTLWECLLSAAGCGLDRAWSSGLRPLLRYAPAEAQN